MSFIHTKGSLSRLPLIHTKGSDLFALLAKRLPFDLQRAPAQRFGFFQLALLVQKIHESIQVTGQRQALLAVGLLRPQAMPRIHQLGFVKLPLYSTFIFRYTYI